MVGSRDYFFPTADEAEAGKRLFRRARRIGCPAAVLLRFRTAHPPREAGEYAHDEKGACLHRGKIHTGQGGSLTGL